MNYRTGVGHICCGLGRQDKRVQKLDSPIGHDCGWHRKHIPQRKTYCLVYMMLHSAAVAPQMTAVSSQLPIICRTSYLAKERCSLSSFALIQSTFIVHCRSSHRRRQPRREHGGPSRKSSSWGLAARFLSWARRAQLLCSETVYPSAALFLVLPQKCPALEKLDTPRNCPYRYGSHMIPGVTSRHQNTNTTGTGDRCKSCRN